MIMKKHFFGKGLVVAGVLFFCACGQDKGTAGASDAPVAGETESAPLEWRDYGKEPKVLDIEAYTLANDNFRLALWSGSNFQLTLMSIPVGGEIGLELHADIDQFLRIEEGEGRVLMGDAKDSLHFVQDVKEDFAVFIPAGKWHNLVNTGDKPVKLYSIYAPVEHPYGTVHKTQAEAMEAEAHHHH